MQFLHWQPVTNLALSVYEKMKIWSVLYGGGGLFQIFVVIGWLDNSGRSP